jgi:hypothetical protein
MASEKEPLVIIEDVSFGAVLDKTCERLWDKKIQYSLRRIRELGDKLSDLETELDELIFRESKNPRPQTQVKSYRNL